jgi:CHRD domain
MDSIKRKWVGAAMLVGAAGLVGGCSMMHNMMGGDEKMGGSNTQSVALSGGNEVPAVMTSATGSGTVTVNADHTVSARITVSGMTPTAAHIHEAAAGANGPVIVPFTKSGDDTFVAPPGAKLTDAQYDAFKAGRTYVNVHSAKSPSGEIRAQLKGN